MGTEFTLTSDDSRPENASVLEDVAELALLTAEGTTTDLAWTDVPQEF